MLGEVDLHEQVQKVLSDRHIWRTHFELMPKENFKLGYRNTEVSLVRRDGTSAVFLPSEKIALYMNRYCEMWIRYFSQNTNKMDLASSCAHFFRFFISIHPFPDGNGRTTKEILRQLVELQGYAVSSFYLIDRYLFTNDSKNDLSELTNLFFISLEDNEIKNVGGSFL